MVSIYLFEMDSSLIWDRQCNVKSLIAISKERWIIQLNPFQSLSFEFQIWIYVFRMHRENQLTFLDIHDTVQNDLLRKETAIKYNRLWTWIILSLWRRVIPCLLYIIVRCWSKERPILLGISIFISLFITNLAQFIIFMTTHSHW